MSRESATSIRHLPALDGLRGLALLGVLFFHAGGVLRGGFLGVDLFFVLSGFLITSLLLSEHRATGHIALKPFWIRRARRLFPALLSLMPAIAMYARFFAKPTELAGLRADALATLGYVANWRAIFAHKSYWELFAAPSPLEHTWSLSIEEQFYVVWPLTVAFVLSKRSRRFLLGLTLVLAAISMAAMILLYDPEKTSRVYLGTDTRAASILFGAALAMLVSTDKVFKKSTVWILDGLGVVSAVGLGYAWFKLTGDTPFLYRGGFWLTEIASLVLILCAISGSRSLVARALSLKPLRMIGTISYGLYLWHWPINVFVTAERVHVHGLRLHAIQFALTFFIAIVSYVVLEKPIRTRGLPFGRPIYVVPTLVALIVLLVVRGTHARESTNATQLDGMATPTSPANIEPVFEPADYRIVMFGDSTANSLGWTIRGVHQPGLVVENLGQDGCSMLRDSCNGETWADQMEKLKPNAALVFFGGAYLYGITVDGQWTKSCVPAWDDKFEATVAMRLGNLTPLHNKVWLMTVPYPLARYDNATYRHETDCINASLRKAAASVPGVTILDFAERLCPQGDCQREFEGAEIRPDGVHYSMDGGVDVSRWVLREVQAH